MAFDWWVPWLWNSLPIIIKGPLEITNDFHQQENFNYFAAWILFYFISFFYNVCCGTMERGVLSPELWQEKQLWGRFPQYFWRQGWLIDRWCGGCIHAEINSRLILIVHTQGLSLIHDWLGISVKDIFVVLTCKVCTIRGRLAVSGWSAEVLLSWQEFSFLAFQGKSIFSHLFMPVAAAAPVSSYLIPLPGWRPPQNLSNV